MPKDRGANSSSFDRAMVSPYARSLTNSDRNTSSPPAGHEVEWEEAQCPICIEHPHNAVLLLCSSGCRPFMCNTSYRHSNCLYQYCKSSSQRDLICPLCRGRVTGWIAIEPARRYMNSKTRNCSLETCSFSGTYSELRKHARVEHPSGRPSEASPTRQSNWQMLELRRDIEGALGHQSDLEFDFDGWLDLDIFGEDDIWSDGSFLNWRVAMSDVEDDLMDRMFSPSVFSSPYIISSSSSDVEIFDDIWSDRSFLNWRVAMSDVEDDLMDRMSSPSVVSLPYSISSSSSDVEIFDDIWSDQSFSRVAMSNVEDELMGRMSRPSLFSLHCIISSYSSDVEFLEEVMDSTSSISMLFDQEQNGLPSSSENGPTISREDNVTNLGSRSNYPSSRSSHHVETSRSRTNYYRENAFTRSSYHREKGGSS